MKKTKILAVIFGIVSSCSVFAEHVLNFDYYGSLENRNYLAPRHSPETNKAIFTSESSFAGFNFDYSCFFESDNPYSFGINSYFSFDFFNKATVSTSEQYSELNFETGCNICALFGAAFKYDINKNFYLTADAGLRFSRLFGQTGSTASADPYYNLRIYDIKLDLTSGCTYIFFSKDKISLGVNFGIDFAVPLFGFAKYSYIVQSKAESFNESYFTFGTDAISFSAGLTLLLK